MPLLSGVQQLVHGRKAAHTLQAGIYLRNVPKNGSLRKWSASANPQLEELGSR